MSKKRAKLFDNYVTLWGQFWIDCQIIVPVKARKGCVVNMVENTADLNINIVNSLEKDDDDLLLIDADDIEDEDEKERQKIEQQSLLLALNNGDSSDLVGAEDVPDVPTTWLWKGYLGNQVTLFTGSSGSMKTHLSTKIAAWFSAGQTLPDGEQAPCFPVIMINQEDTMQELKRRISANGGDLSNVKFLPRVKVNDPENIRTVGMQPFQLPRDMHVLARAIEKIHAGLVIIDPVGACVHNAKNDQYVREQVMTPLTEMCEELDVCVLFVNHTRRGNYNENNFLSFMSNAKAFHEAARMSVLIMPELNSDGVSVWKQVKNSVHKRMPQLRFCVEETPTSKGPFVKFLEDDAVNLPSFLNPISDLTSVQKDIQALIYREGNDEIGVHQAMIVQSLRRRHPASTVKMSLSRMVESGKLERSSRGIYNLPPRLRRRQP
jgi:hypothetical protein